LRAAETNYRTAIRLEPGQAAPHYGLANLLKQHPALFGERKASLRGAATHYRTAIRLDPGSAVPHNGLANLLSDHPALFGERQASLRAAETHYRMAIRLDQGYVDPHNGLANLLSDHPALFGEGEASLAAAESHYRMAIRLDPGYAIPYHGLANLLNQHRSLFGEREASLRAAETHYRTAIRLDRQISGPWFGLSELYLQTEPADHILPAGCFRRFIWLKQQAKHSRVILQKTEFFLHPLVYLEALEKLGIELGQFGRRAAEVRAEAEPFLCALSALDQAELGEFERKELRGLVRHLGGDVRGAFKALDELDSEDAAENNIGLQFQLAYQVAQRLGNHQPEREFALSVVDTIEQQRTLTSEEAFYAGCLHLLGDHPVGRTADVLDALKRDVKPCTSANRDAALQCFKQAGDFLPARYQLWDLETDSQSREQRMREILDAEGQRAAAGKPTLLLFHQPAPAAGVSPADALAAGIRHCVMLAQLGELLQRFYQFAAASHPQQVNELATLVGREEALYHPKPGQALATVLAAHDAPLPGPEELREQLVRVLGKWGLQLDPGVKQPVKQIGIFIGNQVMSTRAGEQEVRAIWVRRWVLLYQWEERIGAEDAVRLLLYLNYKVEHEQRHPAAYDIPRLGPGERNMLQAGSALLGVYLGITVPVAIPIKVILKLSGIFGPTVFTAMQKSMGQRQAGEFPDFDTFCRELDETKEDSAEAEVV